MRKVLVVNLTRFGDLLQTTPTIVGLREQHPGAELVALVERNFADVARGLPAVDRVWELDLDGLGRMLIGETGDGLRAAYRVVDYTVKALREERFDLALNYSSSKMSAVLLRLIGAPDTRGWTMSADGHRLIAHPWSRLFAASCLTRRQAPFNLVDYYKRVAGVVAGPQRLFFDVPVDARRWATDFLAEAGLASGTPLVAFQLGGMVLGLVLLWAGSPLYPRYAHSSLGGLTDQRAAAAVMMGSGTALTAVGEIMAGSGTRWLDGRGRAVAVAPGFEHFRG